MPKKKAVSEEGLSHTETHDIKRILISFQSGTYTKEQTTHKIIDLLQSRETMGTVVWEDLKDTVEFVGFELDHTRELISYVKMEYLRQSRVIS